MFEKIARYAEQLATSAGRSRRGFLGRLGQGALGAAGLLGGLLLLPGEAAPPCSGGCRYKCPDLSEHETNCSSTCECAASVQHRGMTCPLFKRTCAAG